MAVKVVCVCLILLPAVFALNLQRGEQCTTPNSERATCDPFSSCKIIRDALIAKTPGAVGFAKDSQCGYDTEALVCCGSKATQTITSCTTPNGEMATCIPVTKCDVIGNAIKTGRRDAIDFAQQSQCGFTTLPLVCCGSQGFPAPIAPPVIKPSISHLLPNRSHCGYAKADDRVYGGEITDIGEFPWMALLRYKRTEDGGDAGFKCGGTLINRRYILTAAHCVLINPSQGFDIDSVRLGEWRISTTEDCEEGLVNDECSLPVVDLKIQNITVYPQYERRSGRHDIAIIRLERNVDFTDYVRAICMPEPDSPEPPAGTELVVAGWGSTENSSSSDYKLKVKVPLVEKSVCAAKVKQRGQITENQLCAGALSGKDSCQGDSGGPLMATYENSLTIKNQWYQEGVVSWGVGCGIAGYPGIYTKVSKYIRWIADNLQEF